MALPTNIPITYGLFQQGLVLGAEATPGTNAAANMSFVNDGYTVLLVANGNGSPTTVTVYGVPDNAGRTVGWTFALAVPAGSTGFFGPYRPIWWNMSGVLNVSFSVTADVVVQAVSIQT
jgi:hypothetical protein